MLFPSRLLLSSAVLASALTLTSLAAHAFVDIPNAAPVVDLTGTLTEQQQQALTTKIADIDSRTGTEVAMLMVPTTGEESVQSYSWRVAEAWKPGHEGVNRGLVVVIAKNDRKSYLQVGRGLDQVIPSEQAIQLAKNMSPFFRKGQYYEGLDKDLDDVAALAATLPAPDGMTSQQPQEALQAAPAPAPATPADAIPNAAGDPLDFIFKYGMPLIGLALLVQLLRWVMTSNSGDYPSTSSSPSSTSVSRSTPSSGGNSGSGFATGFVVGAAIAESERRSSSSSSSSSSDYSSPSSSSPYSDSSSTPSSDSGGSFGGTGGGDGW